MTDVTVTDFCQSRRNILSEPGVTDIVGRTMNGSHRLNIYTDRLKLMDSDLLLTIGRVVLYIIPSFVLCVVIHEAGHFAFGSMSGYRLCCICLFGLAIVIDRDDRPVLRHDTHFMLGGYCIMTTEKKDKGPYLLILGGCILNWLTGLMALLIAALINPHPLFLIVFSALAMLMGVGGLFFPPEGSDGQTFNEVRKTSKEVYNNIMMVHRMVIEGKTFGEIPGKLLNHGFKPETSLAYELDLYRWYSLIENGYEDRDKLKKAVSHYGDRCFGKVEEDILGLLTDNHYKLPIPSISGRCNDSRKMLCMLLAMKREGTGQEELAACNKKIDAYIKNSVYSGEWKSIKRISQGFGGK